MSVKRLLAPFFCILVSAGTGIAGVIYDNGAPDKYHGSEMTHWTQADDFYLADPARLDTVTFWDFEQPGFFAGTIIWQLYADNGTGAPGALLFSGTSRNLSHTGTGFTVFGNFAEYWTTFDIGPISLPRGAYWLALHNGDWSNGLNGNYQSWNVYWEATANSSGSPSQRKTAPYDGGWVSNLFPNPTLPPDLAFQISGASAPSLLELELNTGEAQMSFVSPAAQVSFGSSVGTTYQVQFKDVLSSRSWNVLSGADQLQGTGDIISVGDSTVKNATRRFYRVTVLYEGAGAPVISAFGITATQPQISFITTAEYFYSVQYKNDLSDTVWTPVSGAETVIGSGGVMQISDSDPNLAAFPHRFYRVTLQ